MLSTATPLRFHSTRIRLWGIDAPESDQLCRGEDSLPYRCGAKAANDLAAFIARRPVVCIPVALDQYGRAVATCSVSGTDPGCVKTPTSDLRVESLSRLRRITKEPFWQSPSEEEKRENNSAHSLLVRVFTQPGPIAGWLVAQGLALDWPQYSTRMRAKVDDLCREREALRRMRDGTPREL
jgi:endonuclease YncB( thermonuclease family)